MCCLLCSWFVEINTWQVLKCIYLVQCLLLVEIYAWHSYFGWACISEPVNSNFRGNSYLITRLYSLKYKVTCVVHVSHAWISRYIYTLRRYLYTDCFAYIGGICTLRVFVHNGLYLYTEGICTFWGGIYTI